MDQGSLILAWILLGPLFALLLFNLGEKRWGNGPTWAFLGFAFNIFGLLAYLLIMAWEQNESSSIGSAEHRRIQKIMHAAAGWRTRPAAQEPVEDIEPGGDAEIDDLLRKHMPQEALNRAKERYHIAFQHGDTVKEELYGGYMTRIIEQDEALKAKLEELRRDEEGSQSLPS